MSKPIDDSPEATEKTGCGCTHAHDTAASPATVSEASDLPPDRGATVLHIPGMDCAAEESEIRHALADIHGIEALNFQLAARTLSIRASREALPWALAAIKQAGFEATVRAAGDDSGAQGDQRLWPFFLALTLAIGAEAQDFFAPDVPMLKWVGMALAITAIALSGVSTYRKGLAALLRRQLNINALMSVAVTGAFLIGQWPEAAMVMALYAIAELIEARSVDRARNAIKGLLDLTPETASIKQVGGEWQDVPVADVVLDTVVQVKPGARIPLDGMVTAGSSAVNQAPVTGESIPVDKAIGDMVFAGTINETATLEFRVTARANDTTLARIIHAVEQAQGTRAPTQRFVDRFTTIYTPVVFAIAVGVAVLSPWLLELSWTQALYKALVLLVIACPCALVIATPVTVVSGLAAAARRGILIKGGVYLEEARKLRVIALDKTGTITEGKPRLVAREMMTDAVGEAQAMLWAASLAGHSDHPVSQAIARGLALPGNGVEEFSALPGRGVQGRIGDRWLTLGNHRLIEERGLCGSAIEARLEAHETAGCTVTLLASEQQVLAIFAVADTIKESSRAAVAELHALGVSSVMLTGDNSATAATIARQAGIDDARGNLLPEDKLAAIEELQRRYGPAAMTGDGINDAPALARADIGIAMGGAGTDIAMEAADVVIMNDDLRRIPETIRLSRATHGVLWQNIVLALGIKAVFLVLAVTGNATMWMAVFADMGASLLVVGNGLRLLRK